MVKPPERALKGFLDEKSLLAGIEQLRSAFNLTDCFPDSDSSCRRGPYNPSLAALGMSEVDNLPSTTE